MGRLTSAIVAVIVCGVACGGRAAATQPGSGTQSGDLSVWNAANVPHDHVVLLQCRGGAGYEYKNLGTKTSQNETQVAISMVFAANAREAGSDNQYLQPGTCAPSDRPFGPTEPRELHFITLAFAQLFPGPIDIKDTAAQFRPDVRSLIDYLADSSHYWTFHAADTHHGYFDVTMHEYWVDRSGRPPLPQPVQLDQLKIVRWLIRVSVAGGIAGTRREVSVNGDGHLQATGSGTFGHLSCTLQLSSPLSVQHLEAALARSHPETWLPAYVKKDNPSGCCDQFQSAIHVDQEDARGQRSSHETHWFNDSAAMVPQGITALFNLVYETQHACAF